MQVCDCLHGCKCLSAMLICGVPGAKTSQNEVLGLNVYLFENPFLGDAIIMLKQYRRVNTPTHRVKLE